MPDADAAIEIRDVRKTFGPLCAVDGLNLTIPRGSLCGFLGPNGAGKTTTIRMVMSILFPDSGEITVLGKKSAIESKDRIGYLPEERGMYRKMKTTDFLIFTARLKGIDTGEAKKRAGAWLERIGLPEVAKKKCEELSKGMQQKVQLASTLIHEPDLIILDEPFSGLDPVNARLLRDLILELHNAGRTIIFSTHVLHQAEQLCERIVLIDRGRKVLDDTLAGIRKRFDPRTILVRTDEPPTEMAGIAGVQSINQLNGEWELHLDDDATAVNIMRDVMAKHNVAKVECRQPTLEDIFIQLVDDARVNEFGEVEVGQASVAEGVGHG